MQLTPLKANISEDMMWNGNEEDDGVTLAIIRDLESDCDDESEARFHLSQGRCIYYDYPGTDELVRECPDGRIEPVDVDDAGCIFVKSLGPPRP